MTDRLAAVAGVRQLHARYADAVWRQDALAFADCHAENAEWRIAGLVLRGRDAIAGALGRLTADVERTFMRFGPPLVDLRDGAARARTFVTEQNAMKAGPPWSTIGTYYEVLVERDGRWRRAWALFQLHYKGPADLTGAFFDQTDYGPPPGFPPLDAPTFSSAELLKC